MRRRRKASWAGLPVLAAVMAAGCVGGTATGPNLMMKGDLKRLRARASDLRLELRAAERRVQALRAQANSSEKEMRSLADALRPFGVKVTPLVSYPMKSHRC